MKKCTVCLLVVCACASILEPLLETGLHKEANPREQAAPKIQEVQITSLVGHFIATIKPDDGPERELAGESAVDSVLKYASAPVAVSNVGPISGTKFFNIRALKFREL